MAYLLLILWTSMAPPQQIDPVSSASAARRVSTVARSCKRGSEISSIGNIGSWMGIPNPDEART